MSLANFYLITDTHFFKNDLGAYGKEYDDFMRFEQKCFAETEAINNAVFDLLAKTEKTDNILIAGDLSFNGEKESHKGFIKLLNELKSKGKNVYVVTADHDFKNEGDKCYGYTTEKGKFEVEATRRNELYDLYYEFGFKNAIAVDTQHLSYVAQIADGVRLLALNNDGSPTAHKTFDDEQIEWIKEQAKKAREDNQMMFAMNHYPLLPGQPIFSVISSAVQKNASYITDVLADEGVHLVFTGHMHNQSINVKTTEKGNKFYDVCTGAIIASPASMRFVTIEDKNTVKIETEAIPDFIWDTDGRTCEKYLSDLFDGMILNMLEDMKDNPDRIMGKFGIKNDKLRPIIKFIGKKLNKITVGKTCRLVLIKCDKSIKKMLLKDYITKLVRDVFSGNQSFKKGTPEGDVFLRFIKRFNFIFKRINLKNIDGEKVDLFEILKHSAGNYDTDDYNAILKLS